VSDVAALNDAEELLADTSNHSRRFAAYPEYRPSTLSGIARLPSHWRSKPLKRVARVNPDDLPDSTDDNYRLEYIDISSVDYLNGVIDVESYRFEDAPSRARRRVQHGDTIISTVRTYLKAVAQIENPPENCIASTGFAVLRPGPEIDPGFLYRVVQSEEFVGRVVAYAQNRLSQL
jgi:type I restriction enzyme S subunit